MRGYASREYAESLSEFGAPLELPRSGGWLLQRHIGTSGLRDAMGCYPLFACHNWDLLGDDLDALRSRLVSVALVADPFGAPDPDVLRRYFPDACVAFKEHFVTDLTMPAERIATPHHRRNARRALAILEVARAADPLDHLDEWVALYDSLASRHAITDLRKFSRESFSQQLRVPGIVMLRALRDGVAVGASLWYVDGEAAYYHLGAYRDEGYASGASFGMFWRAIELFSGLGTRWLALGAGAGATSASSDEDGLTRFKRGWATGTRTAWFCGRVLNDTAYASLANDTVATQYFPQYRAGEFG